MRSNKAASEFEMALEGLHGYHFRKEKLTQHHGTVSSLLVDDEAIFRYGQLTPPV